MRGHVFGIALSLLVGAPAAADDFCSHLNAFEAAPFARDVKGKPQKRWIEYHWIGAWMDFDKGFSWQCRHSEDMAGAAFCAWLIDNTSIEFHESLPLNILECHGMRWQGDRPMFGEWLGDITLYNSLRKEGGLILLDINMRGRQKPHSAIRLTVYPEGDDEYLDPLPPLIDDTAEPPHKFP